MQQAASQPLPAPKAIQQPEPTPGIQQTGPQPPTLSQGPSMLQPSPDTAAHAGLSTGASPPRSWDILLKAPNRAGPGGGHATGAPSLAQQGTQDDDPRVQQVQQLLQPLGPEGSHLAQPLLKAREALRRVDTVQQDLGHHWGSMRGGAAASRIPRPQARPALKPPLPPAARASSQAAVCQSQAGKQPKPKPKSKPKHPALSQPPQQPELASAPDGRHGNSQEAVGAAVPQAEPAPALQLLQLTESLQAAAAAHAVQHEHRPKHAAGGKGAVHAHAGPGQMVDPSLATSRSAGTGAPTIRDPCSTSSSPIVQLVSLLYELAGLASGLLEGGKELARVALRYPMQILQVSCCAPIRPGSQCCSSMSALWLWQLQRLVVAPIHTFSKNDGSACGPIIGLIDRDTTACDSAAALPCELSCRRTPAGLPPSQAMRLRRLAEQ